MGQVSLPELRRYKYSPSFATGALGVGVAAAAGRHYGGLVAGAAVFGISVAFGNPATNQLAAGLVTAGRHGLVTGVKQSGVPAGAALTTAHCACFRAATSACFCGTRSGANR